MESFDGAEFDFWFGTYVDMRKWLRILEHITKHFEKVTVGVWGSGKPLRFEH